MEVQSKISVETPLLADNLKCDEKDVVKWITNMPIAQQDRAARTHFQLLVRAASQPKHESGNMCIKLCYFIQLSRKSTIESLQKFAFSSLTSLDLFKFYVEWNEKNQHRSMRQVIELLATLINVNPDQLEAQSIRIQILKRLLTILSHRSAQPLVKPGFKAMECLISKGTFSAVEVLDVYLDNVKHQRNVKEPISKSHTEDSTARDAFVSQIFDWMSLPDTAPAAGKLLVTFFQNLRTSPARGDPDIPEEHTFLWQRWIRQGLTIYPDSLENIKNYLFPPLFKLDRAGSVEFLQELSHSAKPSTFGEQEIDVQALLFLSAMEVGKKLGLVDEMSPNSSQKTPSKGREFVVMPAENIAMLLSHSLSTVRSSALSVLISSVSSIRPFPPRTLLSLQRTLNTLHAETDARFRNELLSNTKHMIERLRGAIAYLTREAAVRTVPDKAVSSENASLLLSHQAFLKWYMKFLFAELVPTASYQRHITSLKALEQLARSGYLVTKQNKESRGATLSQSAWPSTVDLTPVDLRLLLDLLMDPFEDVRVSACSLLKLAPYENFDELQIPDVQQDHPQWLVPVQDGNRHMCNDNLAAFFSSEVRHNIIETHNSRELGMLLNFIKVAEDASNRSGRADLADGVARSYELLSSLMPNDYTRYCLIDALTGVLEQRVSQAKLSLAEAVTTAPIHGQFATLRLVWGTILNGPDPFQNVATLHSEDTPLASPKLNWNELQYRMVNCCANIWAHVEHVLCNDSPEGSLLEESEDMESIDTKDVLSYSFRAVHESSNLLRAMANKLLPKAAGSTHLLPYELFPKVGNLTFSQLSDLRHRGAFSTVSLTFAHCCQLTQDYGGDGQQANMLLQTWYQNALSCIFEQVSTTRRSAGIPALMTGILSANSKSPSFEDVLSKLKSVAQRPVALSELDEVALPQVHAMNCLKEIFKSSVLGKRCENHIADCLEIAADSLNSKIWAIRNCGLLFLRSLIDCLFGTSESKTVNETGWDGRSIKLSYERYPALPNLLIRLLKSDPETQGDSQPVAIGTVQSVFPALDIIRRAGPPAGRGEEFFSLVASHLGSKIWHMRDIAARTLCTMLLRDDWLQDVIELLGKYNGSANWLHGVLLSIRYLLEKRLELRQETELDGISSLMNQYLAEIEDCPVLEAAYDDVVNICLQFQTNRHEPHHSLDVDKRYVAKEIFRCKDSSAYNAKSSLPRKAAALCSISYFTRIGRLDLLGENLVFAAKHDIDTALLVLERLPLEWKMDNYSQKTLAMFKDVYLSVLAATDSGEVRAIALRDLAGHFQRVQEQAIMRQNMEQPEQQRQAFTEHTHGERPQVYSQVQSSQQDSRTAQMGPNGHWSNIDDKMITKMIQKVAELNHSNIVGLYHLRPQALPVASHSRVWAVSGQQQKTRKTADVSQKQSISVASQQTVPFSPRDIPRPSLLTNTGPELSTAEIQTSGLVLLMECLSTPVWPTHGILTQKLEAWGEMLRAALRAENEFDTRRSAVVALSVFYRGFHSEIVGHPARMCFVSSILALYDAMNDDDEDIRDSGASVVSQMMGVCHMPMAAGRELLLWCQRSFDDTVSFQQAIYKRVTGTRGMGQFETIPQASEQIRVAVRRDDALFIEEEQNLYIDEFTESSLWNDLLANSSDVSWDVSPVMGLSAWALEGLVELEGVMVVQNFGWTSKAKAFAIFMKVITAANTALLIWAKNKELYSIEADLCELADKTTNLLQVHLTRLFHQGTVFKIHPFLLEQIRQY